MNKERKKKTIGKNCLFIHYKLRFKKNEYEEERSKEKHRKNIVFVITLHYIKCCATQWKRKRNVHEEVTIMPLPLLYLFFFLFLNCKINVNSFCFIFIVLLLSPLHSVITINLQNCDVHCDLFYFIFSFLCFHFVYEWNDSGYVCSASAQMYIRIFVDCFIYFFFLRRLHL